MEDARGAKNCQKLYVDPIHIEFTEWRNQSYFVIFERNLNFKYYFCVVLEEDGFSEKPFFQCFVAEDGQRGEGHHVGYLGDGQQVGQGGEGSQEGKGVVRLIGYVLYFFTYDTWCLIFFLTCTKKLGRLPIL